MIDVINLLNEYCSWIAISMKNWEPNMIVNRREQKIINDDNIIKIIKFNI